jgi:hypothetical protein
MRKIMLALTVIAVTLTLTLTVAYYVWASHNRQGENSLPTASPMPTPSPSPTTTPTSTPISTGPPPTLPPTTDGSFGPLGIFGITSPSNKTYSSSTLTLEVNGKVIVGTNVELIMTYSLDGQERIPLQIETQPASPGDILIGAINGSVTLPQLSEGSHNITVFGDLEVNGPHLSQITVYFTVNSTSP